MPTARTGGGFNQGLPGRQVGGSGFNPNDYRMSNYENPGNDPTSTADVNRPTYGSGGSQQQQQQSSGYGNHPANAEYVSDDGLVSYDRYGRRLDANGNVAYGSYGGGGGGGGGGGSSYWQGLYPNQPQGPNPNSTIPRGSVVVGPDGVPRYQPAPGEQTSGEGEYSTGMGMPSIGWQEFINAPADQRNLPADFYSWYLPAQQQGYNQYSSDRDFSEGMRRDNRNYDRNIFESDRAYADQRQQMDWGREQQNWDNAAELDNRLFGQEMGRGRLAFDTEMGRGNLQLGQGNLQLGRDQFSHAQAQDYYNRGEDRRRYDQGFGLEDYATREGLRQSNAQIGNQANQFARNLEREYYGMDLEDAYRNRALDQEGALQGRMLDLQAQGMSQDEAHRRAVLEQEELLNQRGLDYQTQWNREDLGFQYANMNTQAGLQNRGYDIQERGMGLDNDYRNRALTQEGALAGRGYDLQERQITQADLQFAQRHGLDAQQVADARWQSEQQSGQGWAGLDLQGQELSQRGAIEREQMALERELAYARLAADRESSNLATAGRRVQPNARWLRQS